MSESGDTHASTHDDYDLFWERCGRTVHFAMIGHEVGIPNRDVIALPALPYASE